ncbi:FAD binding domain-containing protein [Cubamyces menziesii]|nr:FAD binding domain-containing protein [Cubamyces menziesii]
MSKPESKPVLVVGAGPAGLMAALNLTKNGVPVRIIEKLPEFHHASRGTGAHARSLEIYYYLGMLDDFLNIASGVPDMVAYKLPGGTEPQKTWKLWDPMTPTPDRPIVGEKKVSLGQYRLEGIFRKHLSALGVNIELATELVDCVQDDEGITATLKKNDSEVEKARFAYVIGADGARGVTRKLIGATFAGQTKEADGQVWADLELEGLSDDYWHLWSEPGRFTVTIRASGDGENHFHAGIIGVNFDPIDLTDPEKFVNFIYENTGRRDLKFKNFLSISYWKPKMRMVNKFYSGRAFIVGDAAHVHSPTGGQGLNTSVQDSFNLAWKIALVYKGYARPELLSSFEAERLPVVSHMLSNTTELYGHIVAEKDGATREVDEDRSGFLQWRNKALFQLDINYRWSPIVLDARGQGDLDETALKARAYVGYPGEPVHAGDRAPGAPGLVDASGKEIRLHDIFKTTLHTILIFSPETPDAEKQIDAVIKTVQSLPENTAQVVILGRHGVPKARDGTVGYHDTQGYAYGAYYAEEDKVTVVAVRPDTYIGAFVFEADDLKSYFSLIFRNL